MKWFSVLQLRNSFAVLLLSACINFTASAAVTPAPLDELKVSLNRLVRQQNIQLGQYNSQLNTAAHSELREAVFAMSEVFYHCSLSWRGMVAQFEAVDAECASQAPHTPESLASETEADLNQCLLVVDDTFNAVTLPIETSVIAEISESSKLNFWLQSKMFAQSKGTKTATPPLLDRFDTLAVSREIFRKAVLWDNVGSIQHYRNVKGVPGPLTSAGESGFFCGYNICNVKILGKLRATEAFLNTNCVQNVARDNSTGEESTMPEALLKL